MPTLFWQRVEHKLTMTSGVVGHSRVSSEAFLDQLHADFGNVLPPSLRKITLWLANPKMVQASMLLATPLRSLAAWLIFILQK
jgi:hypothetical protein